MRIFLLFLATFATTCTIAQDGGLDTSFGDYGTVRTDIDGATDNAFSIVQQTDQKLLVAGMFTVQGQAFPSIVRYNLDGTLDTSFGNNAVAVYDQSGYEDKYYGIVVSQSDGKIIAGVSGNQNVIHRYLPDGSIDVNFGNNGEVVTLSAMYNECKLAMLNDDSFIAVGKLDEGGISKVALKKYMPNGSLDSSFGNNGVVITGVGNESSYGINIEIAQDNTIIVLANSLDNSVYSQVLLRYLPDGLLDTTFGNSGIAFVANDPDYTSRNLALYSDGKIAVASLAFDYQNEQSFNLISRYLPNGSLDTSFGNNGYVSPYGNTLIVRKIEVQENQRLLVFGEVTNFMEGGGPFFVKRYHYDGNLDSGFSFLTDSYENFVSDMLIQQDGKIVCLASTPWYSGQEDIILERHINNPLSVPEYETQKVIIYPNPSNGIFVLKRDVYLENEPYQITDITGKIIASGTLTDSQSQINLSSVQSGVYFLKTSHSVFRLLKN